jgi:hypothetical protein
MAFEQLPLDTRQRRRPSLERLPQSTNYRRQSRQSRY